MTSETNHESTPQPQPPAEEGAQPGAGGGAQPPTTDDAREFIDAMARPAPALPMPEIGQRLHAKVVSIGEETTLLDYGGRAEATIDTRHLRDAQGKPSVGVGQSIEAYVISNSEGIVLAPSMTPAANEALSVIREAAASGVPISGKVSGVNAGGLDIDLAGNRAFCPVSQIDIGFCPDASVFVGQTLEFKVIEYADMGRRIVVSRRALLQQRRDEIASKLRSELMAGEVREGTVARLESFGAFVDLGGIDGMVHVSEISHDRVSQPSEALHVGDRVRVKILEIGKDAKGRDRISLSIKAAGEDPWRHVEGDLAEGQVLTGRVVRLTEFGAFIRLLPGIEGLLHQSEIAAAPDQPVKEGGEVEVRILKIDARRRRVSLTLRREAGPAGMPRVGEVCEGTIRAHKPYGVFIDLPAFGPRTSGLLPLEEAGTSKGSDLAKQFPTGEKLEVVVLQIDEKGRLRLGIPSKTPTSAPQPQVGRGAMSAMADALKRALERNS